MVQGGELVTARATAAVKGPAWQCTHRLIAHPEIRKVEIFQVQHPRRPGIVFPEVRRGGEEGLFGFEQHLGPIRQIWFPERQ